MTELKVGGYLKDPQAIALCKIIRKIVRKDRDVVIAITGYEGSGKSTLANHLGFGISPENYNLTKNISYLPTHKEVITKFNDIPKFSVLNVDEAIKVADNHRWMDTLQIALNHMFATQRYQNKVTILCIPQFKKLNSYLRNHRVRYWIHIPEETEPRRAFVYIKDSDKDLDDPWHMKISIKKKEKFFKNKQLANRTIKDKVYAERRSINYLFDFTFAPLPEQIDKEYKSLKIEANERLSKIGEEEDIIGTDNINIWKKRTYASVKLITEMNEKLPKKERLSQNKIAAILEDYGGAISIHMISKIKAGTRGNKQTKSKSDTDKKRLLFTLQGVQEKQ